MVLKERGVGFKPTESFFNQVHFTHRISQTHLLSDDLNSISTPVPNIQQISFCYLETIFPNNTLLERVQTDQMNSKTRYIQAQREPWMQNLSVIHRADQELMFFSNHRRIKCSKVYFEEKIRFPYKYLSPPTSPLYILKNSTLFLFFNT